MPERGEQGRCSPRAAKGTLDKLRHGQSVVGPPEAGDERFLHDRLDIPCLIGDQLEKPRQEVGGSRGTEGLPRECSSCEDIRVPQVGTTSA